MTVTRIEALEMLFAASAHDRFRAARALENLATCDDQAVLRRAQYLEKDAYVIKRLERAIQKSSRDSKVVVCESVAIEDISEIVKAQRAVAIDWISGLLLHEIGAKIGLIDLFAQEEIPDYQESKTKKNVLFLQEIFEGIEHLRSASATPQLEEFSFASLVDEIIDIESASKSISISRVGERPAIVVGDASLLRLAICNGIRNGIEAVLAVKMILLETGQLSADVGTTDVIVSWGTTDTDHWITVIDHGQGVSGSDRVFDVGASTKSGHVGFGLAIAKQAIDSIDGEIRLFASPGGGATYELRWRRTT